MSNAATAGYKLAKIEWESIRKSNATVNLAQVSLYKEKKNHRGVDQFGGIVR